MDIAVAEIQIAEELAALERTFAPMAEEKELAFELDFAPNALPRIHTDPQRLQQILKNLLSNAIKFTEEGSVTLRVGQAEQGILFAGDILAHAERVVAFSVVDTGIGIPADKVRLIFEAFQQADGTTSRRFGGTGLGLSISREIARLLGGEIHVESTPGQGSTFTLYLPEHYVPHAPAESGADILRELSTGVAVATAAAAADGGEPDARAGRGRPGAPGAGRGRRRPRLDRAGRPGRADRRGRRGLRRDRCWRSRASAASRASSRCAATPASRSPGSSGRTRSCSTCSCRCSTAGRCSTGSSATRRRATSPCTSSRAARSASRRSWPAPPPSSRSRRRSRR